MMMKRKGFPDFLIIGAQKAGTTALYHYLSEHPQVQPPKIKEINYFHKDNLYKKGYDYYRSHFYKKNFFSKKMSFEATPAYLYYYKNVPRRIYGYNPKVKIIVALRDPVERMISSLNMFFRIRDNDIKSVINRMESTNPYDVDPLKELYLNEGAMDFEDLIDREKEIMEQEDPPKEPSFIRRGFYKEQIQGWLDVLPYENFFFVDQWELKSRSSEVLNQLCEFIGIDPVYDEKVNGTSYGKSGWEYGEPSEETKHELDRVFKKRNAGLDSLTGKDLSWI